LAQGALLNMLDLWIFLPNINTESGCNNPLIGLTKLQKSFGILG